MSPQAHRRIMISQGDLGTLDHDQGKFALQIGQRIAAQAPAWRERYGIAIDFHLREKLFGPLGSEVGYLSAPPVDSPAPELIHPT